MVGIDAMSDASRSVEIVCATANYFGEREMRLKAVRSE